jgi:hypothetical protein
VNLGQLRAEVLNHGFDPQLFPSGRIDNYINDAYMQICGSVKYFQDEASRPIQTIAGLALQPFPSDLNNLRALVDTDRQVPLSQVTLSDIDYAPLASGRPTAFAIDGPGGLHLYPTPDGVYNLLLRYWALPPKLVLDSDEPTLPDQWHRLLWYWGCKEAYASEDDPQTSQYWQQQFNQTLSQFTADAKFLAEYPTELRGSWDNTYVGLGKPGWH